MIAQAMRSAIAPVRIPMKTELRLHTTVNNPDATTTVMVRQVRTTVAPPPERRHNPQKSQKPQCHLRESLYFLTDRLPTRAG